MTKNVFLIAGRTGGPYFPLPTFEKELSEAQSIYIGVKGGFEDKMAKRHEKKIVFLPQAKFDLLSFRRFDNLQEFLIYIPVSLINLFWLAFSFLKCFYLNLRYKPKLIVSTGSFLAVPVIYTNLITNKLKLTKTKIVVHQQDPLPGMSNKLVAKHSNFTSVVFPYTKENYTVFQKSSVIPNPIEKEKYDFSKDEALKYLKKNRESTYNFFNKKAKQPIVLIFGGGSGAKKINEWVYKDLKLLLKQFRIIHITGLYQQNKDISGDGYLQLDFLYEEMIYVMKLVDLVICRSGLASITELLQLQKPAYLIPLPYTHQELNAELVNDYFYILEHGEEHKNIAQWTDIIYTTYPQFFHNIKYPNQEDNLEKLEDYFNRVRNFI